MEKRTERPLLSRANIGSSLSKDLGVLVLTFPHLKSTATSWSEKVFRGSTVPHLKPTATSWSGRRGDEHIRVKRRRAVAAAILSRDACLGGGARKAQAPVPWLMGAAFGARTPIAEFMPRLRETEARFPSPNSDHGRGERRWERVFLPLKKKTTLEALVPDAGTKP